MLVLSAIVHVIYYVSAYGAHIVDPLFQHVTVGQDFFQVPNGAYAFLRGGTLHGELPAGIEPYMVFEGINDNVYHPLFTLIVGTPLQLFAPDTAYGIWGGVHVILSVATVAFLWLKFRDHRWLFPVLSFYLAFSYHYYEIKHAQYHALLSFFVLLFLYESTAHGDTRRAGALFFLSLLVKPVGLLWVAPLLLYRRVRTVAVGLGLFVTTTIPFVVTSLAGYYVDNFVMVAERHIVTYNLYAITHFIAVPDGAFTVVQVLVALGLIGYQWRHRPSLATVVLLWIVFQLLFYSFVFPYHYVILPSVIAVLILTDRIKPSRLLWFALIGLALPAPVIWFRLQGAPAVLPEGARAVVALWSVCWLVLSSAIIIVSEDRRK